MTRDFVQRFSLDISIDRAQKAFINRISNLVFGDLLANQGSATQWTVRTQIATALGERMNAHKSIEDYIEDDFLRTLRALEAFYASWRDGTVLKVQTSDLIEYILSLSETDLGIRWKDGKFFPAGARELDDALANDVLNWLSSDKLTEVRAAFEKALNHFMQSSNRPELRKDVITDAYEALESLAKVATEKNRELSGNREFFLSAIKAPPEIQNLIREYINYACDYRHGPGWESRPTPSEADTEMFLYMTGALIRRALHSSRREPS